MNKDLANDVDQIVGRLTPPQLQVLAESPREAWPYIALDAQYKMVDGIFRVEDGLRLISLCVRFGDAPVEDEVRRCARARMS